MTIGLYVVAPIAAFAALAANVGGGDVQRVRSMLQLERILRVL
jgi:hypothetical protein